MKNNTVIASDGAEIYTSNIQALADEFIERELDEERRQDIYNNSNTFMAMILYIADNLDKPDNNDIELLDNIFNIYIRLCVKYNMLPTLECFSMLININPSTLSRWSSGEYRTNIYYDSKGNYMFYALSYWNDYYLALMFINKQQLYPLQYYLYNMFSNVQFMANQANASLGYNINIPLETTKMATICVTIVPIILLYPIAQKYITKGVIVGAVKG